MPRDPDALTPKEQALVNALLADPTMTVKDAALAAGYSPKTAKVTGHEVVNRPRVKAILDARRQQACERADVDAEFVVRRAVNVLNGAEEDREWNAANGTLTLLAKMRGGLTDKVSVTFRDVRKLSDEELEAEAKALGLDS